MKKKNPIVLRWLKGFVLVAFVIALAANPRVIFSQAANPWETTAGQACFEKWISESMSKLNAYNGSADFNARKLWSINRYGVLEGNPQVGPRSVAAPDNFPQYNNNKYWWMWDNWIPAGTNGTWTFPEWNGAGIENIRTFVTRCAPAPAGNTTTNAQAAQCVGTPETITVSATKPDAPTSQTVLQTGKAYLLKMSGVFSYWDASGQTAGVDALYNYREAQPLLWSPLWLDGKELKQLYPNEAAVPKYNPDHTYTLELTGEGKPITLKINETGSYGDNSGSLTVALCASSAAGTTTAQGPCSWAGVWNTNWGVMTLSQNGNQVTGTYTHFEGKLSGMVTGNVLSGRWDNVQNTTGKFQFTMAADCNSFSGFYGYNEGTPGYPWNGTRGATNTGGACSWTGVWDTSYNKMTLTQTGSRVNGAYEHNNGKIEGTVSGNVLEGTWTEGTSTGRIRFTIATDCNSFSGGFGYGTNEPAPSNWNGTRSASAPPSPYTLKTSKDLYGANESITVEFAGLTGKQGDWITITKASDADTSYGQWYYTGDKTNGTLPFSALPAGAYQARLYLDWPTGGHNVAARYNFQVQGTGTGAMSLEAPRRVTAPNNLLLIPITLNNAANVANLNFDLQYDAAVIQLEGNPSKGNLLDNALFSANTKDRGIVRNGLAQTRGSSGTGIVVNLPFRIIGKPGDKSPLTLNVTTINDPNGGALTIERIPGEIVIANDNGTLPGGGNTGGGNTGGGNTGGGNTGGPTPIPPPVIPPGDCDSDLALSELDALCALEMSVGLRPPLPIMDVDGGGITSRDAVIILLRAVGGR